MAAYWLCRAIVSSASSPPPKFTVTASLGMLEETHDRSSTSVKEKLAETEIYGIQSDEIKPGSKTKGPCRNPLNWFGILVPPALRATQEAFSHAVVESIPTLASVNEEMRFVEEEIRTKRQELGRRL